MGRQARVEELGLAKDVDSEMMKHRGNRACSWGSRSCRSSRNVRSSRESYGNGGYGYGDGGGGLVET